MKKKRMLALLLTVAMAGTMLAGCGRSDGKEDGEQQNLYYNSHSRNLLCKLIYGYTITH